MTEILRPGFGVSAVDYLAGLELQHAAHQAVVAASGNSTDASAKASASHNANADASASGARCAAGGHVGRDAKLILLEHQSVYTAGKRTEPSERPSDGTPVIDVDRGGKITWHGPGQLVGYPILRLPDPIDVVGYVRLLESMLIDVVTEFGIECGRVAGRSGVWITGGEIDLKIAAIGIRVAQGVTSHGFSLNCSNSMEPYSAIVACGLPDAGVTTISDQLGRTVTPEALSPLVEAKFDSVIAALDGLVRLTAAAPARVVAA